MPPLDRKSLDERERERDTSKLRAYFEREIAEMRAEMDRERRECHAVLEQAARLHRLAVAMRVMEPSPGTWVQ